MRDDVALSFDGADPYRTAANRRGGGGGMSGMQGGPGGSSALPFMSFDLGNVSEPPPRVSASSYSGGGGGFGAFEDEAPLLEGEFPALASLAI